MANSLSTREKEILRRLLENPRVKTTYDEVLAFFKDDRTSFDWITSPLFALKGPNSTYAALQRGDVNRVIQDFNTLTENGLTV